MSAEFKPVTLLAEARAGGETTSKRATGFTDARAVGRGWERF